MNLLEVCDDYFQYICQLMRTAEVGGDMDYILAQSKLEKILSDIEHETGGQGWDEQFKTLKAILCFYADSFISESNIAIASNWNDHRLAYKLDPPEYAGDDKFYEYLDDALADSSKKASEILSVFYTCLGLGFVGNADERKINKLMQRISGRLYAIEDSGTSMIISSKEYHIETTDLRTPPTMKLTLIVIALVGMMAVLLIANNFLFKWHTDDLTSAMDQIIQYERPPPSKR